MKKNLLSMLFFVSITITPNRGQSTPVEKGLQTITQDALQAQLGFLASDWMQGRAAGERGEYLAADYIASILQLYGVKPGGDLLAGRNHSDNNTSRQRSYFQDFVLLKTIAGDEQLFSLKTSDVKMSKTINFTRNVDFTVRASDPGMEIEAPVVFTGYGFKMDKIKYNSFSKINVKGKFILRISGIPEFILESQNRSEIEASYKSTEAELREMGVLGIIEFNPQYALVGYPERKEFLNMSPSETTPQPENQNIRWTIPGKKPADNLVRISISVKTANEILKGSGINIDDYIKKADMNESYPIPPLTDKTIYLKTSVKTTQVTVRNILGIIEGANPDQFIVVGAHYDHMGISKGYIWNGADDNGSGTVGVMTLARAIMETGKKPEKTIIISLWTAEEEGLLGSRYYVEHTTYPLKNVKLYINFDMISRYISDDEPKKVTMTYTSSFSRLRDITAVNLEKHTIDLTVDYQPSADPPGGSDHRSFVAAGIPIMRFKPGHREEYHTPGDEVGTVDWDIMEKIIRISFANTWELANTEW
jgi:hypothetical protein